LTNKIKVVDMIEVTLARGKNKIEEKMRNREVILKFFKDNKGGSIADCARKTGIGRGTISRHIKSINEGDK
jgi:predicted transcriptional regulator